MLLIGCGTITRLEPIVALAQDENTRDNAILTFYTIGTRRLVDLSCHEDEQVRQPAARALALLCGFNDMDGAVDRLAGKMSVTGKIRLLNNLCRPFPQAVGMFELIVDQTKAPFMIQIEQIGRTFYLRIGHREFRSLLAEKRTFVIPIDQWCCATGSAVDSRAVRKLLGGSVRLLSPTGAGWEGTIHVTVKEIPAGPLPGFLPFEPTEPKQTVELPVFIQ
jgi:hypothetical protein